MSLETGTYISDLVATNPTATDPKSQGDDHLRLVKSTIKTTFPNVSGAVTATHGQLNNIDHPTRETVYNNTGSTIAVTKAVYVAGSSGNRITVGLAKADSPATAATTIAITYESISNNSEGTVVTDGHIHNINTSGLTEGQSVWLSATTAGELTSTEPSAPNLSVLLGFCVKSHASTGILYVKVDNGERIEELHNVDISSVADKDTIQYDSATQTWKNYTPANTRTRLGLAIGTDVQAYDADLAAVAGLSFNGLIARTGSGTAAARTLTGPAAGLSVSNGDGVSGNPTIALANDLSAVEGLSGTGLAVRTATDTWANRTITAGAGVTVTNGDGVAGNPTIAVTPGVGNGDVLGPSSSVDSEIALFDSTTGKVIKRATTTGILKATSGVLAAATAGTDFVTPTGTETLTNKTLSGADNTITADGTNAVGFRAIPQNSQSAAYTLVLSDSGKHILHPSADTTARTFTIPANSSVAFPIGTAITFVNQNGAGVVTIAITTDTMRLAGAGTTGSRTLAANGVATAVKVTSTEWIISGTGLT